MTPSKCTFTAGFLACVSLVSIGASGAMQVGERDAEWMAPSEASADLNPKAENGGRKLFTQRCTACHGDDGRGTTKGPDATRRSGANRWRPLLEDQ
jgi:cytochrome c